MPESPLTKISFIEPMSALAVRKLPEGLDWLYEIKFDGYRCLAGKDAGGVSLWSRRGNDFTSQFPAIAKACEYLPDGTLVEGVIAKRRDSFYESGKRSGAWVKYKINKGQEFVIGGYTPGNPFDAVIVGYYQEGKLLYAGKVRAGFVPHVRREVMAKMKALKTEACPFANLPEKKRTQWALTSDEMKNCQWLKPKLVAQVEFTEWTPDGHLRHASFLGLRDDKDPREVVREP